MSFLDPTVPIEWAAGRILERYRLPRHARMKEQVIFYILTRDARCFNDREPLEVLISNANRPRRDPDAFDIVVKGIDEFVTKEDWMRVWDQHVKWRQGRLWQLRGQRPQGRRSVDLARLRKVIQLYSAKVEDRLSVPQLLASIGADSNSETILADIDQETIRRAVNDLDVLLTPQD